MFCHKCGAEIADGAAFCHKCGAEILYESAKLGEPGRLQAKKKALKWLIFGVCIIIAVGIIAVMVINIVNDSEISDSLHDVFDAHIREDDELPHSSVSGESSDSDPKTSAPTVQEDDSRITKEREDAQRAYAQKVRELVAENSDLRFDLIELTGNDVLELVADNPGYYIQIFSWTNGNLVSLGDEYWPYGLTGNYGYEYLPGQNLIRNFSSEQAGAIVYEYYWRINSANELKRLPGAQELSMWYFRDENGNGLMDKNEPFCDEPIYYVGNAKVSADVYASYQVTDDFELISGVKTAEIMLTQLNSELETESTSPKELLFNGIAAYDLLGMSVDSVMEEWGVPLDFTEGGGVNYCTYDGITLSFDYQRTIYNVEMSSNMCQFGDIVLNKDRLGLIDVLGSPTREEWGTDDDDNKVYRMWYDDFCGEGALRAELVSPNKPAHGIWIW